MQIQLESRAIQYLQNFETPELNKIARFVSSLFHFKYFIIIITVLYLTNYINSNHLFIILSSQFILLTVKYLIKRKRPFQSHSNIRNLETMSFDEFSFPSGHTFAAFLLYFTLKPNKIFIIIPILVGLSRIYMGVHYPTDIIGAIILAKIMTKLYK